MNKQAKHSPLPWDWHTHPNGRNSKRRDGDDRQMRFLVASDGQGFAHTVGLEHDTDEANAAFIVRAVNHHDELVALLEEIKRELNGGMNTLDTAASAKPLEMKIDAILSAINRSAS